MASEQLEQNNAPVIDPVLHEEEEVEIDEDGRRVSFWSFFREAGNVPLHELLRREDETMNAASKESATIKTPPKANNVEKKQSKPLSIRVPSFFSKKSSTSNVTTKPKMIETNEEEKEEE